MADAKSTQTLVKSIRDAYKLVNEDDIWIGIGRTTAWPDENEPPDPEITTQDIAEIVGLVLPETIGTVIPDENGEIEFPGYNWHMLTPPYSLEEMIAQEARWVYISGWLMYDQFPVVTYRQECVYVDVVKAEGVLPGATVLLPAQVESYGTMLVFTNRKKVERSESKKEFVEFILEC